ncbi:MAG: hypothetical protein ACXWT1_05805 [Methylobacter sp.]
MTDKKTPPKPQPPRPSDFSESREKAGYVVDTLKPPPRPQDRNNNNDPKQR